MTKEFFPEITSIPYVGNASSPKDFSFNYYNADEKINGHKMRDWLKFSVAYWHTFGQELNDIFGDGTAVRPWQGMKAMKLAEAKAEAAFEFFQKLGVDYYTFHDRDVSFEGDTLRATNKNLDAITDILVQKQESSGIKVLWNTANMFTNPRFMQGAASSPSVDIFSYAAGQVKQGLDTAKKIGAANYVFWGGREGYESLLNTDMKREQNNLALFYQMAADYADSINYQGQLLLEPKPKEPMVHQYDFDAATTICFLQTYGLAERFKLNLEGNHANLAGHTYQHEIRVARDAHMLGSLDANQGDKLIGWDIDEFPSNLYEAVLAMYEVVENDGLGNGGMNFDAKPRRSSFTPEDMFRAHIVGMDTYAAGLRVALRLKEEHVFEDVIHARYSSFDQPLGQKIKRGEVTFNELNNFILDKPQKRLLSHLQSDHLESLKATLNYYMIDTLK